MHTRRTPRWRRHVERQHSRARRVIAIGGGVSLALGIIAEFVVIGHTPHDIAGLVRVTIMLPTVIFLGWWALQPTSPNVGVAQAAAQDALDAAGSDVIARMKTIETAFDSAAVPQARRDHSSVAPDVVDGFRHSVRTPAHQTPDQTLRTFGFAGRASTGTDDSVE